MVPIADPASDTLDVAFGRPAFQSSLSQWSQENDARRAVSGPTGMPFAFHTDVESAPFWYVDLQLIRRVRRIVVNNRSDAWGERAVPLHVECSVSGQDWTLLSVVFYSFGTAETGEPLVLSIPGGIDARYVRLRRIGAPAAPLHLGQVQVFTGVNDFTWSAQLRQDLWVVQMTCARGGGAFLDLGATDGVTINNTLVLEKQFGWTGVCVEPNPDYYGSLIVNRSAQAFNLAVSQRGDELCEFLPCAELGTISGFEDADLHASTRHASMEKMPSIVVETITPVELMRVSGLPSLVDYVSIDTEGSEWEILSGFNMESVKFGLITIEHNHVDEKRTLIRNYLSGLGYHCVPVQWDDWYYHPSYLDELNKGVKLDYSAVSHAFADQY